ncbi:uracil-DNA glycosylase [candidate division KSB1 bacterium]|nr:uracil-DNA glycosylase [candidate division KSB1 bacterium]
MINTAEEPLKEFINQQIELYGDEAVISKDLFFTVDKKNELIRNEYLFCEGNPEALLALVAETSRTGDEPLDSFFGNETGILLEKILKSINLNRKDVLVCSVRKSDPSNKIEKNHAEQTLNNIEKQIELVGPAFILCLGTTSARILLKNDQEIGSLRGRFMNYKDYRLLVTYHPETLINNPELKRATWEDIKLLKHEYNKYNLNNV